MSQPLLSICIPTYNREDYLRECLDSVVGQFVNDGFLDQVEIVISDNASVDNTEALVRSYQKRFGNIKYFKLASTITSALNWDNAVQNASGKYINTIGDDDMYLPGSLDKLLPILAAEESKMIVVAHILLINEKIQLADNYAHESTKISVENIAKNFFAFAPAPESEKFRLGPGFLFFLGEAVRGVKKETGFFWKDPIGDHWAVFSVLVDQDSFVFFDAPIVACRVHAGNHLAIKYKSAKMANLMTGFLSLHDHDYKVFPGSSFTNLGYLGMQDIQFHFTLYRQFPINTDQGLCLHINDILHSDFSNKDKLKHAFKSLSLVKRQKFSCLAKLFGKSLRFFGRFIVSYFSKGNQEK